ncbi:invasion-associated locus B family protein [Rhodobacter veldkampii DSM 11550]|uniref:Invasion associated locus B family protein n=2 Tax=Phaeovulum veldkampii TaxID=33049 RepID=A0A2T4JN72_9RHOB|nr:invasion associated locus B family protein [Phaeovulum veldkampii]MBK5945509.1 invasion-associated locus B family protein [Phaeovulum veldkampii DSM 11550]PTE19345.1 invasion associated locus B family protein [Phaeovulum veldkampii DSM 11550]TDQ62297.1 invasion protein IalB [Phaeovulum veldkampii DSM 11550]
MSDLSKSLVIALVLGLAAPALAQDAAAPATEAPAAEAPASEAPAAQAPAADAENKVGSTYVAETQGDWQVQCVRTEDGKDPCQLYQLLKDNKGNSVAEISLFGLPDGQKAAAGATIITPLETLLTENVRIKIDSGEPKVYPFTFCARIGCVARLGFTAEEVAELKKGNKAVLSIVPIAAPDQKVELPVSLKGFTAGYDAVKKANDAAR